MKHRIDRIIVSRPRRRTSCSCCAARASRLARRHGRAAARIAYDQTDGDGENFVRIKHRPRLRPVDFTQHADHLSPLERALEKRVGDAWNAVWSDISSVSDPRSLRGWHLRQHVNFLVEQDPLAVASEAVTGFYVEAGILKFRKPT